MKDLVSAFILIAFFIGPLHGQPSPNHKLVQYIGNTRYVTPEEEAKRNWCDDYWCTNDVFYMLLKSSQYIGVDPCIDFKNFSVNHVEEVDHISDRVLFRGFSNYVQERHIERQRKVVAEKYNPKEDNRVIKVVKNTFQKCLKSPFTFRHVQAHKDLIAKLESLGGSLFLARHLAFNPLRFSDDEDWFIYLVPGDLDRTDLWDESKFDLVNVIEEEPNHALLVFFDMKIKRCEHPSDKNEEVLCLKDTKGNTWYLEDEEYDYSTYKEALDDYEDRHLLGPHKRKYLEEKLIKPVAKNVRKFFVKMKETYNLHSSNESTLVKIKELKDLIPDLKVDWLKIFNSHLFEESQVTEEEEIMINGGIKLLQELAKNLMQFEEEIIADVFCLTFFYRYRTDVILRFHNSQSENQGVKHADFRWVTCLQHFRNYLHPALLVMYNRRLATFDRTLGDFGRDMPDRHNIYGHGKEFIQEAVDYYKKRFIEGTDLPLSISADILSKLKNMNIIVGFTEEILRVDKLDFFYKNLKLKGNEEYMESRWEIESHETKIRNEPRGGWRRRIDEMVDKQEAFNPKYWIDNGNVFYIQPLWFVYPFYHPLRPRFFNMATLYQLVLITLDADISEYVKKKWNHSNFTTGIDDSSQVAYESYKEWLKNNTDKHIGGNLLTHEQLYWMATAVRYYLKFHPHAPKNLHSVGRLHYEYMHVFFKSKAGFQEAFNCTLNDADLEQEKEYDRKWDEISG